MKIKKEVYLGLLAFFIVLVFLAFFLIYMYNEAKTEKVLELIEQGYICEKNEIGIYIKCSKPINFTNNLNLSMEEKWLNISS